MDYSNAMTDESRLQELLNDYQKKKTALTAGEGIFNALNNVPTLGQAMGKIPRAQEQNINLTQFAGDDPRLAEKNRIAGVLQNLDIAKAKRDEDASRLAVQQGETDRAGMASMLTPLAKKYGIEVTPGMSTGTLKTASDLIKSQSELAQKKYASDEANRLRSELSEAKTASTAAKLPVEIQQGLNEGIKKNVEKTLISNQLKEFYDKITDKKVPEDQKLALARQSIKTLNSVEGKDAVGAEEAARLASFLEVGPNWQKGVFSWNPAIDKFADQMGLTIQGLDSAVANNSVFLDKLKSSGKVTPIEFSPGLKSKYSGFNNDAQATQQAPKKNVKDMTIEELMKEAGE